MFIEYNPHPNGKLVGDCVKRALTKASGKEYREVANELNRIKRDIGASAFNSKSVWDKYLRENLSATYRSYPAEKGKSRMNVERFCKEHPTGTYVLNVARHMVCCEDGHFYDTWDCSDKCVYGAYEIHKSSPAPQVLMPMPGIERLSALEAEYSMKGNHLIEEFAEDLDIRVRKSKGTLWISLSHDQYAIVRNRLLNDKRFSHFNWETLRGHDKSRVWDERSGIEFILYSGEKAYLWCTKSGMYES